MDAQKIRDNLDRVRDRIAGAAAGKGRRPEDVRLLAVTKTVGAAEVDALYAAGQRHFGENRVVETIRRLGPEVERWPDSRWHMIGHLQRNKVRKALGFFHEIDSVDSMRLLNEIAGEAQGQGTDCYPVLAEVNAGGEACKTGMPPGELKGFLAEASKAGNVRVMGLMTMAPIVRDPEKARPVFARLRGLLEEANAGGWYREKMADLSMGMSQDYAVAVEEGSTWVRIGAALFGEDSAASR